MIIEMYAIRHSPTGYYLHASSRGRGMTQNEPFPVDPGRLPRMFVSKAAAKRALKCWCRGRYIIGYEDGGSLWTGEIKHVDSRVFEDMEIVTITVEIP